MKTNFIHPLVAGLLLAGTLTSQAAWKPAKGFFVPEATKSPDGKYGVLVPDEDHTKGGNQQNEIVELKTGKVIGAIEATPYAVWKADGGASSMSGYGLGAAWSADGTTLSWSVGGEWFPEAWLLIKIEDSQIASQVDLLEGVQIAMLAATKDTVPENYAAAVKMNKENGSAYPDGFTVIPSTPETGFSLPWNCGCTIDSNPKGIERLPAKGNIGASANFQIEPNGDVTLLAFKIDHQLTGVARAEGATASELLPPMMQEGYKAADEPVEKPAKPAAKPSVGGKGLGIPKDNPLATFVFPKLWTAGYEEDGSITASISEDVVIYLQPIDATDVTGQLAEAKKAIAKEGVKFNKKASAEGAFTRNGIDFYSVFWNGNYEGGDTEVRQYTMTLPVTDPDKAVDVAILITVWGAPEDIEKNTGSIDQILDGIKAKGAK